MADSFSSVAVVTTVPSKRVLSVSFATPHSPANEEAGAGVDDGKKEKVLNRRERMKSKLMETLGIGKRTAALKSTAGEEGTSKHTKNRKEVNLDRLTAHLKAKLERR